MFRNSLKVFGGAGITPEGSARGQGSLSGGTHEAEGEEQWFRVTRVTLFLTSFPLAPVPGDREGPKALPEFRAARSKPGGGRRKNFPSWAHGRPALLCADPGWVCSVLPQSNSTAADQLLSLVLLSPF